ncbi:hypothetical protein CDL15_Pgr014444 [Punica granatum]|uniref:Uncharacterized protein n=1 Tax=Punica granatum TaxID=22663 RepID=A0A218WEY1_PUNGR|nr:hypothetical protein CDL15_Pgr014444 [Punica granatum]
MNGVSSAFFASLERCSCIRIATKDDFGDEGNDLPLIYNDGNLPRDSSAGSVTSMARRRKGNMKSTGAFVVED